MMGSVSLILLIFCLKALTIVLASIEHSTPLTEEKKQNEVVPPKRAQVLPYILQKKKSDINSEKQYTLLTAATKGTVPNTRIHFSNVHENGDSNRETLIDKTEIDVVDNALSKIDTFGNWQHMPNFMQTSYGPESVNGYNPIANAFKHYYANAVHTPSHEFGTFPAAPTSLLLLINLGVLSYCLLGVLGLLNRIFGTGFNGFGVFPGTSHTIYDNLGHGQFGSLRKVEKDIQSEYGD